MRFNLDSIFPKNSKPMYQNQGNQNSEYENVHHFSISAIKPIQNDYEVAEISYEEFTNSVLLERRKQPRKLGETRRAYNKQ
jgi:hypothetical protein